MAAHRVAIPDGLEDKLKRTFGAISTNYDGEYFNVFAHMLNDSNRKLYLLRSLKPVLTTQNMPFTPMANLPVHYELFEQVMSEAGKEIRSAFKGTESDVWTVSTDDKPFVSLELIEQNLLAEEDVDLMEIEQDRQILLARIQQQMELIKTSRCM